MFVGCFLGCGLRLLNCFLSSFFFPFSLFFCFQFFLFFLLDVGLELLIGECFLDQFVLILYHGGDGAKALKVVTRLIILHWLLLLLARCFLLNHVAGYKSLRGICLLLLLLHAYQLLQWSLVKLINRWFHLFIRVRTTLWTCNKCRLMLSPNKVYLLLLLHFG